MATRLDSANCAVRFIERWKRGLTAAIVVSVALILPSVLASIGLEKLFELLGGSPFSQAVAAVFGLAVAGPWVIGSRDTLARIGGLAKIADD